MIQLIKSKMELREGYNRTVLEFTEKLGENGQRYPNHRPSAVVNVATDWFTGVRLKCLSKCTVGFCNEMIFVRGKDHLQLLSPF